MFKKLTQPIPVAEIQKHYAASLEVELAKQKAQRELLAVFMPAHQAFDETCKKYGVNKDEYDFDLKSGTMTKKVKEDVQ